MLAVVREAGLRRRREVLGDRERPSRVAEYFPAPSQTGFTDDRQHAVSLVYVIPVTGECEPRQDALELTWMTPQEILSDDVQQEFSGGRGNLVRQALAFAGVGQ